MRFLSREVRRVRRWLGGVLRILLRPYGMEGTAIEYPKGGHILCSDDPESRTILLRILEALFYTGCTVMVEPEFQIESLSEQRFWLLFEEPAFCHSFPCIF